MQDAGEQGERNSENSESERDRRPARAMEPQHAASLCAGVGRRTPADAYAGGAHVRPARDQFRSDYWRQF